MDPLLFRIACLAAGGVLRLNKSASADVHISVRVSHVSVDERSLAAAGTKFKHVQLAVEYQNIPSEFVGP